MCTLSDAYDIQSVLIYMLKNEKFASKPQHSILYPIVSSMSGYIT